MLKKVLVLLLVCAWPSPARPADFFIQDGDVVCFWGNSITDDGVYPRMIENFVLARFPEWNVKFFNLGWGGDRAQNVERLKRDIQLCKPTKVTIMLGMNDAGYRPFDSGLLEIYLNSLKQEIEIFRQHSNARIMLVSPTPYDLRCRHDQVRGKVKDPAEVARTLYPEALRIFSVELQKLALAEGLPFVDLNSEMSRVLEEVDDRDGNFMLTAEGVHPNVDGQFQMGLCILEGMGAPVLVSETSIDAAAGKVLAQDGCSVTGLKTSDGKLSFTRKDTRLPLPVYPSTRPLIRQVLGWPSRWERDLLSVKGLAPGWYRISIDNTEIDIVSSAELESGVNLSSYPNTPMMIQAYRVFEQTERRTDAFYNKWRSVLLEGVRGPTDFTPFKTGVDTKALDLAENEAFLAQHRANLPGSHGFVIAPAAHPAFKVCPSISAGSFLEDMVRVSISVDSRTLRSFKPPLVLRGNFSCAPRYSWGIIESKGYYADIPVPLYDNGTHGDKLAGDGIYSIEMFFRKNSGRLNFLVQDGSYLVNYWNSLDPESRNPWCAQLTSAWSKLTGGQDNNLDRVWNISLDRDTDLTWDKTLFGKALAEKLIYQP